MRLASLERLANGLRQAPHEYRPSLHVFPDVSVEAMARALRVSERGRDNGKLDLPSAASASFDEVEHAIIEHIYSDRKTAHHTLIDQLETYTQRLTALDFHGRFTVIQHAAPAAVTEFRAEALQGRDELHRLRRTLLENEEERDEFKQQNRLRRAPRVSSRAANFFKVALLIFLFVSETYINAAFLAKENVKASLAARPKRLVFAILNVLISFALGLGGVRQLNCRGLFRKFLGLCVAHLLGSHLRSLLNLALAHYREVSGALYDDAGEQVIQRLLPDCLRALSDIRSWLFFGIGMVWAVFALFDGVFFTDPYPGYAPLEHSRAVKAHQDYIDCKTCAHRPVARYPRRGHSADGRGATRPCQTPCRTRRYPCWSGATNSVVRTTPGPAGTGGRRAAVGLP